MLVYFILQEVVPLVKSMLGHGHTPLGRIISHQRKQVNFLRLVKDLTSK